MHGRPVPEAVRWHLSYRADPAVRPLADRHYNRQSPGSPQFVPPGRCLVLSMPGAFWVTSWPFAEHVKHAWPGAMICSAFRNEGAGLSSDLIREALAATLWRWPMPPPFGLVTFVDAGEVRRKRDPGRCFLRAGFVRCGETKGGLLAFRMPERGAVGPDLWPSPCAPWGAQADLLAALA